MSDEKGIAGVLSAMLSVFDKDRQEAFEAIADHPSIVKAREYINKGDAEDFHLTTVYPINSLLGELVRSSLKANGVENPALHHAEFLFLHADEIERHYVKLITQREGMGCSADKSRTIMRELAKFFMTGQPIVFDYTQEYTYHLPVRVFTTHDVIVEFFHGLHEFHYGNPGRYVKALGAVLNGADRTDGGHA